MQRSASRQDLKSSAAVPRVPSVLTEAADLPKDEESALISLFITLSSSRPRPSEGEARTALAAAYWIVDWALTNEKLKKSEAKIAAMTTKLQDVSEESTQTLKHLKFLQTNLYAQQEDTISLQQKIDHHETNDRRLATELHALKVQLKEAKEEIAEKDSKILLLEMKVKELSLQSNDACTRVIFEMKPIPEPAKEDCVNCMVLSQKLAEEQRKFSKQLRESEERVVAAKASAERRINDEVEAMLRQLQEYYRSGWQGKS